MEILVEEVLKSCQELKTKLSEYFKYKDTINTVDNIKLPLEDRIKYAESLFTQLETNYQQGHATKLLLTQFQVRLSSLLGVIQKEISTFDDGSFNYNTTIDVLVSLETQRLNEKKLELQKSFDSIVSVTSEKINNLMKLKKASEGQKNTKKSEETEVVLRGENQKSEPPDLTNNSQNSKIEMSPLFDQTESSQNSQKLTEKVEKSPTKKNSIVEKSEVEKLREWTGLRHKVLVFDSAVNDWSVGSSVFNDKICDLPNLVFFIETAEKDLFGGYIESGVSECAECYYNYNYDQNAFIFSMRIGGVETKKKYVIKKEAANHAFCVLEKNHTFLFGFGGGHDICVYKDGQMGSYCKASTFTAQSGQLCTNNKFKPVRVVVYQMK
ncbi:hypothetical protein EIN_328200 [Entamoeba invadens IP1]|uniref:TLDc domain-containing protein n=1 Tax=Entamoeba invadens IP1 TaxID=370355 RepID=A0A0A1U0Y2_ENTIV|nr:hypothetical protein EIN_328200 [Entamoeba invadens IP1]ELP86153.1 hypothetical protein EIN_328200 [Entamoeba invadens IP1]|eukprot:XP_004185499.1 hypothetical protein EIN_328200 [Entamoeba invadens IP1]